MPSRRAKKKAAAKSSAAKATTQIPSQWGRVVAIMIVSILLGVFIAFNLKSPLSSFESHEPATISAVTNTISHNQVTTLTSACATMTVTEYVTVTIPVVRQIVVHILTEKDRKLPDGDLNGIQLGGFIELAQSQAVRISKRVKHLFRQFSNHTASS
jgi:hypothetical protein